MSYVVTQHCCADATCVDVCPVDCIHPTPEEPDYGNAEMLYIDPDACVDCGACADVCPVGAIAPDYDLARPDLPFIDLNAAYFQGKDRGPSTAEPFRRRGPSLVEASRGWLDVAIVGSGPSGWYAAEELLSLRDTDVSVTMFERLPVPFGLARFGVAPDHQLTKTITAVFERTATHPNFSLHLNVEVGRDVEHADLARAFHAVIYAVGALDDRSLGIPGEDLEGSHSATEFVAWYNGHPDFVDRTFDLDTRTAVIVGNGNVALDVARILASDANSLRRTDIAQHALDALAQSRIEDVVVVGRRGPREAAFTQPELLGLVGHPDFDGRIDPADSQSLPDSDATEAFEPGELKLRTLMALREHRHPRPRRVTLGFGLSPMEIVGGSSVEGLVVARNDLVTVNDGTVMAHPTSRIEELECGLVFRSVGYRGTEILGVPFDQRRGVFPHRDGRVEASIGGVPLHGVYATGWIKRGPSGMLGTNRLCARETVATLLKDHVAGRLSSEGGVAIERIHQQLPHSTGMEAWREIDRRELVAGQAVGRPRIKIVDREILLDATTSSRGE